jgi:hypothetical protein
MAAYSEAELRYARPLVSGLIADSAFRAWLAKDPELAFASHDPTMQSRLRSPGMKNPCWFNYWCGKDTKCACRIGTGIETDVLLVFVRSEGGCTALHVEVKRTNDKLGDGQAESYPRRASCWRDPLTRPPTVPAHDRARLVLVHGFSAPPDVALRSFDVLWHHKDIAQHIMGYPAS